MPTMPQAEQTAVRRRLHPLIWILLAGALVRLLLLVWFQGQPLYVWDERDYNELAVNLLQRGEFYFGHELTSCRPPLYPAFVAGVYACFGLENYGAVRLLQGIIALLTVVLVYRLGAEVYDRRIGLWASGLFCFYPEMLGHNNLLLTETLFTFWLVLVCLALTRLLQRTTLAYAALAGVCLGLGALTRSVLWLSPPLVALFLLACWRVPWSRRIAAAVLLVAAFAVTIAPWAIRNTRLHKTFIGIDAMGGRNFMMGNYAHTPLTRAWDAISVSGPQAWHAVLSAENPDFRRMTQGERDKLAFRYGLRFVREHPGLTAERDLVKFFNFWQLDRAIVAGLCQGYYGAPPRAVVALLALLIFGSYAALMCTGIFGAVLTPPRDTAVFLVLLATIAFVCGVHTVVFGHSRYHLPLMPLVAVFSASALCQAQTIWQRRATWRFWLAAVVCLILVTSWVSEIALIDAPKFLKFLFPAS